MVPIIHHNALATRVKVMARRVRISTTKIKGINQTNKRRSMIIPTEMDNQLVHMVPVETKVEKLQPNIRKINTKHKQLRIKIIPKHFPICITHSMILSGMSHRIRSDSEAFF